MEKVKKKEEGDKKEEKRYRRGMKALKEIKKIPVINRTINTEVTISKAGLGDITNEKK